ncbi:MAG TPA: transglycosylase SLT domain-containing protein [Usitatibacter sp.]|nr:transglycosylase SLT domain-containing protein [Usitatibacter sp.]
MALTSIKWISAAVCAAAALAAPWAAAAASPTDADLAAAREALRKGRWQAIEQLRPRFAGTILAAYPAFWLLDGDIQHADANEVRDFLLRNPTGPLAETLRRDWLKALGAAADWDAFRAERPRLIADDAEIDCYSLQERLARNDASAPREAHALYVEGREEPDACDPVFDALAAQGRVSEDETWSRLRKLLAGGHLKAAKSTDALLPAKSRIAERSLERVAADPARHLAHLGARALDRAGRELAIFAVARLARSRPDEAADRLEELAPRLGVDDAKYAWGQLAWQAALDLDPRALEWYARAAGEPLTDSQVAWKARAALRAGDWKQVLAAIGELSSAVRHEPAWRYWKARALREQGDIAHAQAILRSISGLTSFYGILAAEDLGVQSVPDWKGYRPAAADLQRVRAMPGIQRALLLYRGGLDNDALREWAWAVRDLDDRGLLAAAQIAAEADVPDRAIFTADRTLQLHDFSQRYPIPHREALDAATRQWDLDEAFVYGIIRQESRFLASARSPVGAIGLMQLMPGTARWIARQIPVRPFRTDMLVRPEVNLNMGTYYLHRVMEALGDPILAATAYNAGPTRARRWRDAKPLEGAIYAETIPFGETRDYVKKVFTNAWYYRHRLGGDAPTLHQLLGTVPARDAADSFAANIP